MLINFSVSNFLSFNDLTKFSMIAGSATSHNERITSLSELNLLNFTALYGANASGKSNLVKAFDFSKKVITRDISNMHYEEMHFKLIDSNIDEDTTFEYVILLNNTYYTYGFSVNLKSKKITGEWLFEATPKGDNPIFERNLIDNQFYSNVEFENDESKSYFNFSIKEVNRMENVLLLSEIIRRKNEIDELNMFNEIYDWFENKLVIIFPDTVFNQFHEVFREQSNQSLIQLLKYFDTGIKNYSLSPTTFDKIARDMDSNQLDNLKSFLSNRTAEILDDLKKNPRLKLNGSGILRVNKHLYQISMKNSEFNYSELLFTHTDKDDISFTFGQESDGTRRLIELLDIIHNDHGNTTFIIDELDRSFHPRMTWKFIETYLNLSRNTRTQLIITTHESTVMELSLLRRDEVWFVERDSQKNSSRLYSLEEYKVHNTKKISKDYLIGRYGAVPLFKDFNSFVDINSEAKEKEEHYGNC